MLRPEQLAALVDGRCRTRTIRRAVLVAQVSGWSMALFALLTALSAVFEPYVLVFGAALGAIAVNELRGATMLRALDVRGAQRLGRNQLALGTLLVAYAAWSLWRSFAAPVLAAGGGTTGDPSLDAMVQDIAQAASIAVYGGLAVAGVIIPGLTAWYYFTRAGHIQRAIAETPVWVIDALRACG